MTPLTAPQILCANPTCNCVLDAKYQPSCVASRPGYWLITCLNPDCEMQGFTLSELNYPPKNLDAYLESGRRRLVKKAVSA